MDIYEILSSKNHNSHYLKRYIKYINYYSNRNDDEKYLENHHICPKAKDLFPEYKSFKKHSWNLVKLTPRQHFIAHWMLWKVYGKSMAQGFHCMATMKTNNHKRNFKTNSKVFENLRIDYRKRLSHINNEKVKLGIHIFQNPSKETIKKFSLNTTKRNFEWVSNNIHPWQNGNRTEEHSRKLSESKLGNQNAKGFKHTEKSKQECAKGGKSQKGIKKSQDHVLKMKKYWNMEKICIHCNESKTIGHELHCPKNPDRPQCRRSSKTFRIVDPNNKVYIVIGGLTNFCKNNNLPVKSLKKGIGRAKGWKIEEVIN